jgi:hypothetical protein
MTNKLKKEAAPEPKKRVRRTQAEIDAGITLESKKAPEKKPKAKKKAAKKAAKKKAAPSKTAKTTRHRSNDEYDVTEGKFRRVKVLKDKSIKLRRLNTIVNEGWEFLFTQDCMGGFEIVFQKEKVK